MDSSKSVNSLMKKAVTSAAGFYQNSPDANIGHEQRKLQHQKAQREAKGTLSQWYGMKSVVYKQNDQNSKHQQQQQKGSSSSSSRAIPADVAQEMELLRYRNFLNKDTAHQVPQRSGPQQSEFLEFGYFSDVGKRRRKQIKSFADDWLNESKELQDVVAKRMKLNVKQHHKASHAKEAAARRAESKGGKKKSSKSSKKGGGGDFGEMFGADGEKGAGKKRDDIHSMMQKKSRRRDIM